MTLAFERRLLLSLLGIGLIIAGVFERDYSDIGFLFVELGIAILLFMPFCDYKYSLIVIGLIMLLWNLFWPNLTAVISRPIGSLYLSLVVIIDGIVRIVLPKKPFSLSPKEKG